MKKYSFKIRERNEKVKRIFKKIEKFNLNHKNLIILTVSIFLAYEIITSEHITNILSYAGSFGYIGGFISGILFSYGFSTVPAAAMLFLLAKNLNPFLLALIGAFGGMLGDIIIFKFVRDHLLEEIKFIISEELHLEISFIPKIMCSHVLRKIIPATAGFIMCLPLPGELAMVLLGITKYEFKRTSLLSYIFNFIGIFTIGIVGVLI